MDVVEIPSLPPIFMPILLRSGNKFRSLKQHRFTFDEKTWICQQYSTFLGYFQDPKSLIFTLPLEAFCLRYDISSVVVRDEWIASYTMDEILLAGKCESRYANCSVLDEVSASNMLWFLNDREPCGIHGSYEWNQLWNSEIRATYSRRLS